jgi:hypothetical protein
MRTRTRAEQRWGGGEWGGNWRIEGNLSEGVYPSRFPSKKLLSPCSESSSPCHYHLPCMYRKSFFFVSLPPTPVSPLSHHASFVIHPLCYLPFRGFGQFHRFLAAVDGYRADGMYTNDDLTSITGGSRPHNEIDPATGK